MKTTPADDKPSFGEGPADIDECDRNRWEDDGGLVPLMDCEEHVRVDAV
jgi:hypothetical protein